jgi:hypothetical protein
MTYRTPLRFTILHLAQRFLMEEDTFMISFSFEPVFGNHLPMSNGFCQPVFVSQRLEIILELATFRPGPDF